VDSWITTLADFDAERARWERLYRADPARQVFLSWPWLRAYLAVAAAGWRIAVVRDGDALIAALPLQIRSAPHHRVPIARELAFASEPVGDYQGILCLPEREGEALPRLADQLRALRWDRASLRDVADERIAAILGLLERDGAVVTQTGTTRCLRTPLPATWDEFRKTVSRKTRYQTDYTLRRIGEALPNFRVTTASDADIDAHVDAIVRVNHARWGGNLRSAYARFGRLFRSAHDQGCLRLHVLWDGTEPIGGAASFTDAETNTYSLFQLAYHPEYARYSPGKAALAIALRDAVQSGFTTFDFLRGDEDYKASYAQDEVITRHFGVKRRVIRSILYDAVQPSYRSLKAVAARVVYGPGRTV
jgi:CelD/BcsL family acetyltransferase involved in cellulose biosynthesis